MLSDLYYGTLKTIGITALARRLRHGARLGRSMTRSDGGPKPNFE